MGGRVRLVQVETAVAVTDPSRPVLRLVSSRGVDGARAHRTEIHDTADNTADVDDTAHQVTEDVGDDTLAVVDLADGLDPASRHADRVTVTGRSDVTGLCDEIAADVARLGERAGSVGSVDLQARWDTLRRLCDPADLADLAAHARSLHEAAESVRRQHVETAEDLGPLWDTWEGPAAEAVQDRVSALARSAHALVVELESTADRLGDAHDSVLVAVETLADDLAERPSGTPSADLARRWDEAVSACAEAWAAARRVLAGQPDVSRSGPRFP